MARYALSDDGGGDTGPLPEMEDADEQEEMEGDWRGGGGGGGHDASRERAKAIKEMMKMQDDDVPAPHQKNADGFSIW